MEKFFNRWLAFNYQLIKVLLFFLALLSLLRLIFLFFYFSQWSEGPASEIINMLWYGVRINLKSAGIGGVLWAILIGIPVLLFGRFKLWERLAKGIINLWIGITLFLGFASIPYFYYFNTGFNYLLFQGLDEKWTDLSKTFFANKSFIGLFIGFFILYFFTCKLWQWWMKDSLATKIEVLPFQTKRNATILLVPAIVILAIFCRFGGSLTYGKSLHWENYAVVSNDVLNESILDGVQASYRAWQQRKIVIKTTTRTTNPEQMKSLVRELQPNSSLLDQNMDKISSYIYRKSEGEKIPKPQHIFIILGESQGEWPLLPEYRELKLATGMKEILQRKDSIWISEVLPNGPFTIMGLQSVVVGLADGKQNPQFQKRSYSEVYETGLASQMAKLGYKSNFWYGGPETWEEIERFTLAQGFNQFYGMGRLNKIEKRSVWGISDHDLYEGIAEEFDGTEATVNVILTTSNHAPYQIDYIKEGFPIEEIKQHLTPEQQKNQRLIDQLGHYWYADREMAKFVEKMRGKYPNSLFILTGDHGTRFNLENQAGLIKRMTIPIVISGPGVKKEFFLQGNTASQLQIIPTLIELIAPKNFGYYSLLPSLTQKNDQAVNSEYWMKNRILGGRLDKQTDPPDLYEKVERNLNWEEAVLTYSWWRVIKGDLLY